MATNQIRVNSGGDNYTSAQGTTWNEDFGFNSNSSTYEVSQPVAGTDDSALYQTERFGDEVIYDIPVSNGSYAVNLHFAEGYWQQPNQRLMTIAIEDQPVEDRFDIVAEVGSAHTALVKTYTTNVMDGVLTVRLRAVETGQGYHATIQGLEITSSS